MSDTQSTLIIKQFKDELLYIDPANGYINKFREVITDYRSLGDNNNFDFLTVFTLNSVPSEFLNNNEPSTITVDVIIHAHIRSDDVAGDLTYKVESVKQDLFKWLYQGTGITADKWCRVGEYNVTNTGAVYKEVLLGAVKTFRDADSKIALLEFPLKVK